MKRSEKPVGNQRAVLTVRQLAREFMIGTGMFSQSLVVRALRGVSFEMAEFETLGVVGESGSGKTTMAKIIAGLIAPTSGSVVFNPEVIKDFRKDVQIIFQNPYASLNPRMRVGEAVAEPMLIHRTCGRRDLRRRTAELLSSVGIGEEALDKFPAQFSGGQRQRICIARALACEPKFLVLDEPVSSLDLTVQLKLLELLKALRQKYRFSSLFISHNLGVIRFMADTVLVMYNGTIVEKGPLAQVFDNPSHEYTRSLLEAGR